MAVIYPPWQAEELERLLATTRVLALPKALEQKERQARKIVGKATNLLGSQLFPCPCWPQNGFAWAWDLKLKGKDPERYDAQGDELNFLRIFSGRFGVWNV